MRHVASYAFPHRHGSPVGSIGRTPRPTSRSGTARRGRGRNGGSRSVPGRSASCTDPKVRRAGRSVGPTRAGIGPSDGGRVGQSGTQIKKSTVSHPLSRASFTREACACVHVQSVQGPDAWVHWDEGHSHASRNRPRFEP
eukprot:6016007-Prymnesium_polylepis.1